MPPSQEKVFTGPPIAQGLAVVVVTLIFFVSIWSLKNTVQTEAANMVNACGIAAAQIEEGAANGAQN